MVFLNNRILLAGHDCGGQAISLGIMTGPLSSAANTVQEKLALESCDNATSTATSGGTVVEDPSKQPV